VVIGIATWPSGYLLRFFVPLLARSASLRAGLRRVEGLFVDSFRGLEGPLFHPNIATKWPLPCKPEKKRRHPKILVTKRKETGYIGSCWRTTPSTAT
jgi:hypothetical protein